MRNLRGSKILLSILTMGVLLFGYTNCAKQFVAPDAIVTGSSTSTSGTSSLFAAGTCDQDLEILFDNGYHAFLKNNCNLCHVNGPGKGRFASGNVDDAYSDFMQIGYSKVSDNATSSSHQPPYSGPQNVQSINELRIEWQKGLTDYAACKGTPVDTTPVTTLADLLTLETVQKTIPALDFNQKAVVEWDLTTELGIANGNAGLPVLPGAKFSIQVGKYQSAGGETYYTFTLPRIYKSSVDVHVKTMQVKVNGRLLSYPTTFRYVNTGIYKNVTNDTTSSLITTGSLVAPGAMSTNDKVSFAFQTLEPTSLPPPKPPVIVNVVSAPMVWVNSTTESADVTLNLDRAGETPITVTLSSDTSAICGAKTEPVDVSTCNAALSSFICNGGGCPQSQMLYRARSVVGTSFNRFDWDYKFESTALTFNVGETSKTVRIYFSKDIRREGNHLMTLQIDSSLVGATKGTSDTVQFVFNKISNPVPNPTVPTFTELMQPNGVLAFNCVKCHNSKDLAGSYDMTNYDSMRQLGVIIPFNVESLMFARMNPSSPQYQLDHQMPRDGALPVNQRKIVQDWILGGALNN